MNNDLKGEKCELVTADGGIECGSDEDYEHKEIVNFKLFLAEMVLALRIGKKGGMFIMKMYSISSELSMQLIGVLVMCYEKVRVVKPCTSRPGNS